ncbi:CvpA family protein [Coprococcus comes]|uniref:CvpA family protein n=1 Tax=Coprococcus comes TaxID=410072 RepID=UPI00156E68B5|nr:CvpA family protein [Coprococcus comes]NSG33335.1 CvpA family protein [Coprococcus comes]
MEVNILLVIVGGIIAIGAIVGFAKGAVRIAVSLGATILTLAVVYFATPYVSKAIYSLTPIDEMVEQQCIKTMTKAFTGEADTESGLTEEQVRGILLAAGVSEKTLEAAGITVEDIVNGNVSDEMLQQYGISPDIFNGHASTEEVKQSVMEAEVPKQMQIAAIEGADLPDVFKNLLLENNNSEVYQKLGVTTFAEYVSKYFAKLVIEIIAFLITFLFATIVIRAVVFALDFVTALPVLGILNRLAGVLVGSTISFIIVGILFIVITLLYTTTIGKQAMGMIREDQILSFLYDNNIIMKIATMLR